jgi:hypothetical protein
MNDCGIAPQLSPVDIAGLQRSYGRRITGSIVSPQGNCVASHAAVGVGDGLFMWDCDEANHDQEWYRTIVNNTEHYLYIGGPNNTYYCMGGAATGTQARLMNCSSSDDNRWAFEGVSVRGFGGLCLDLPNSDTTDGNPLIMWACNPDGANQRWNLGGDGRLRFYGTNKCATIVNGRLVMGSCGTGYFTFAAQRIKAGSNCLDVIGPSDYQFTHATGAITNGTQIQAVACNSSMNQRWNLTGPIRGAVNKTRCLARESNSESNATRVVLQTCSTGSSAQTWDYYF